MRLKDHKTALEAAVLAERERCALICETQCIARSFSQLRTDLAVNIRSATLPIKGYIRPETAEKHPNLLEEGYRIAGIGLSADGQRIIGNGKGAEHP